MIYIYIYIEREREREEGFYVNHSNGFNSTNHDGPIGIQFVCWLNFKHTRVGLVFHV